MSPAPIYTLQGEPLLSRACAPKPARHEVFLLMFGFTAGGKGVGEGGTHRPIRGGNRGGAVREAAAAAVAASLRLHTEEIIWDTGGWIRTLTDGSRTGREDARGESRAEGRMEPEPPRTTGVRS